MAFKSDSRHSTGVYVSWNSLARRINFMHINYPIRMPTAIFAPRKSRLDGYSDQVSTKGAAIKLQAELDAAPRFREHFSSCTSRRVHTDPSQRSHVALFGITLRKAVTWFSKPGKQLMAQHFSCGNRLQLEISRGAVRDFITIDTINHTNLIVNTINN